MLHSPEGMNLKWGASQAARYIQFTLRTYSRYRLGARVLVNTPDLKHPVDIKSTGI